MYLTLVGQFKINNRSLCSFCLLMGAKLLKFTGIQVTAVVEGTTGGYSP